jgi:hypothetical protein
MRTSLNRQDYVMLQHLQHAWNRALRENRDPRLTIEKEERAFSLVRRYDPTDGLYHGWISAWRRRLWDERGFMVPVSGDELADVRRAISRFVAIKPRLPPELKDVGQFHNPADLLSIVPTRVAVNRRRIEGERLKAEAIEQSETLFHEGDWRIVRLAGYSAARFWGLGTRWCTTSSRQIYEDHARRSPLLVILTPHGRYQLQVGGPFKDSADRDFDVAVFRDAPRGFRKLVEESR